MLRGPFSDDPVIVVGSGAAGLSLALRLAPHRPVVLVTKGMLGDGSTRHAQGGLAAAVGPDDTVAAHVLDTLDAGAGLVDPEAARAVCAGGPDRVADLILLGVDFDRDADGRLALAREGAHSRARVVHAGGDATGLHIAVALAAAVAAEPGIEVHEGEAVLDLVVRGGRVAGVRTRDAAGRERVRGAGAVVLATGGMGHLFSRTTNPSTATADGVALAARAGAALADLEMTQFHPTALAVDASPLPLVSEAVRGAGAVLRDARGRAFMRHEHPMADLGPRDVVARAIWRHATADGRDVVLDLSHLDPATVHARFPSISAACREHGIDLARDPVPVTPAAHYAMGGVLTDLAGRSTLPGLWAIGECASTGLHGANRLASNSLLEAVVMGRATARDLADPPVAWPEGPVATARPLALGGAPGAEVRARVQRIMWERCGVERDAAGLAAGLRALDALPDPDDHEAAGLLEVARLVVAAAALRTESRGAHFRADHPDPDPAQAHRTGWCGGVPLMLDRATLPAPHVAARKEPS